MSPQTSYIDHEDRSTKLLFLPEIASGECFARSHTPSLLTSLTPNHVRRRICACVQNPSPHILKPLPPINNICRKSIRPGTAFTNSHPSESILLSTIAWFPMDWNMQPNRVTESEISTTASSDIRDIMVVAKYADVSGKEKIGLGQVFGNTRIVVQLRDKRSDIT